MASGSPGQAVYGPKGFGSGSDDALCADADQGHHDSTRRLDSSGLSNSVNVISSVTEFQASRNGRSLLDMFTSQEELTYHHLTSAMDGIMKKYTENLLHLLKGMNQRLSQLELYCYNVEQSIGELRSDFVCDQSESDKKLGSLEKNLQEVHRSVQILRDKQELAVAQKELAELQLGQKDHANVLDSEENKDRVATSAPEVKKHKNLSDAPNQLLALTLRDQVSVQIQTQPFKEPPVQPPALPLAHQHTIPVQMPTNAYRSSPYQILNQPQLRSQPETQCVNQRTQMLEQGQAAPLPPCRVNQSVAHSYPPFQQQWVQQVGPPQPPSVSQIMPQTLPPPTPPVYHPYLIQSSNPPPENFPSSMPMQDPFHGVSQPGFDHSDAVYGYGGLMNENEGSKVSLPTHFPQGGYSQNIHGTGVGGSRPPLPQLMRNHPFSELIKKVVGMGYASDQVARAIQWMEKNGQPINFNTLLDRLNGAPHKGW